VKTNRRTLLKALAALAGLAGAGLPFRLAASPPLKPAPTLAPFYPPYTPPTPEYCLCGTRGECWELEVRDWHHKVPSFFLDMDRQLAGARTVFEFSCMPDVVWVHESCSVERDHHWFRRTSRWVGKEALP